MALGLTLGLWIAIGWRIEHPSRGKPSVTVLMKGYRRAWMEAFVTRQPRIFDAQIMGLLRQGTAFFASTSLLAVGATLALIGNGMQISGVTDVIPGVINAELAPIRLILVVFFLTSAFLKFVWSNRLFGYCAVVMAAVPNEPDLAITYPRAAQAAEINIRAALNFNRGLRAMYFALAALAWVLGPIPLVLGALIVCVLLWQREFASLSQEILTAPKTTTQERAP